jgi:hypothetical protein
MSVKRNVAAARFALHIFARVTVFSFCFTAFSRFKDAIDALYARSQAGKA